MCVWMNHSECSCVDASPELFAVDTAEDCIYVAA